MQEEQIIEAALLAAAFLLAIQPELAVAQRLDRFPLAPGFCEECELTPNLSLFRRELLPEVLLVEFQPCQARVGELQIGARKISRRKQRNLLQSLAAPRRNRLLDGKLGAQRVVSQAQQFALFRLFQCYPKPKKSS